MQDYGRNSCSLLTSGEAIASIVLIYVNSFSVGYVVLRAYKTSSKHPFFIRLPIYLSVGLCTLTLISFVSSLLLISGIVPLTTSIVAWAFLLYKMRRKLLGVARNSSKATIVNRLRVEFIPFILMMFSSLYFAQAIGIMKWPPPGDLLAHSALVSMLLYNGRFTFDMRPLVSAPWWYPPGLHVLSANLSQLLLLQPAETVFVLGGSIAALIPPVVYTITYLTTGSKLLSLVACLSPFLEDGLTNLEYWVFGYFFNGPYPALFGLLTVLTIIAQSLREFESRGSNTVILSILLAQLIITYPSFVLLVGFLTIAIELRRKRKELFHNDKWKIALVGLGLTILCVLLIPSVNSAFSILSSEGGAYNVDPSFFTSNLLGVVILAGLLPSIFMIIIKRGSSLLGMTYVITFFVCLLSSNGSLYSYVWFFQPRRELLLLIPLSWILMSFAVRELSNVIRLWIDQTAWRVSGKKILVIALPVSLFLFQVMAFNSSLYVPTHLDPAVYYGYVGNADAFLADTTASQWIEANIPSDRLILNDMSWSGYQLLGYSYKTVVFQYFTGPPSYTEARQVWLHPDNATLVQLVLTDLHIQYIFTTSEWGYYDKTYFGGDGKYHKKPCSPATYILIFDSYPFLKRIFQDGYSAVYEVTI